MFYEGGPRMPPMGPPAWPFAGTRRYLTGLRCFLLLGRCIDQNKLREISVIEVRGVPKHFESRSFSFESGSRALLWGHGWREEKRSSWTQQGRAANQGQARAERDARLTQEEVVQPLLSCKGARIRHMRVGKHVLYMCVSGRSARAAPPTPKNRDRLSAHALPDSYERSR
jgi:hypothetical protein